MDVSDPTLDRFWELSRDLLAVADMDGNFLRVNPRWKEVTGYTVGELRARPFIEFVHPADRERTIRETEEMGATGRASVSFENRYVCADGSIVWLRWNSTTDEDAQRIYAVATDVTAERRAGRFLETIGRVASAANEAESLDDALRTALVHLCDLTGWTAGHAFVADVVEGRSVLRSSGIWCHGGDEAAIRRMRELTADMALGPNEGLPGRVWATGQSLWVSDVSVVDWWLRGDGESTGMRTVLAFPVRSGDEVVAVLEFFSTDELPRDDGLLRVLDQIGTQLGRVYERLAVAEAQQRALDTERRFLSMLTHELRSPLVSIKGFVGLLLDSWWQFEEERRHEFLQRANNSADRMHRLVEEFLELAKHHERGFEPRTERLRVGASVDDVLEDLGVVADIHVEVDAGLQVHGDLHFLHQVLSNLVANAQRHGEPPIHLTARRHGEAVSLGVRDHGEGVPDAFVDHLFQRFSRADRDAPGTGLGLSICRDLAHAMGGTLTHEHADPGARFVLTLPAA